MVESFHATLLDVMKNAGELGPTGRFARLAPEIARRFDSELMIALATGAYWRGAKDAERRDAADAFRRMSAATYAARFTGYSGQMFEFLSAAPGPRGTMIVKTRIVGPDREPVPLSYVLRKSAAGWRIVDILLKNGISELAIRRSEYRSVLKADGMAGLVRSLDGTTARLLGR